ncbi:MAG: hypothetical protein HY901_27910 [Deltaproteobacteria bacterium]|nr:hypothetical protein [Deltaproteobacteria bacterium]
MGESNEQAASGEVKSTATLSAGEGLFDSPSQIAARRLALEALNADGIPFVIAGAYALREYTGLFRDTKDLDVFCKRDDARRVLASLARIGFRVELTDALWLAKGFAEDGEFVDVIFSSGNGVAEVDDRWFARARRGLVLGIPALLAPPEEIIWSKAYVMERERYDGADVQHLVRHCAQTMDWRYLIWRLGEHPEVLLAHLMLFRFSFPGEKDKVPDWVLDQLIVSSRRPSSSHERTLCRGTLLSSVQYEMDLQEGLRDARPEEVASWRTFRGH